MRFFTICINWLMAGILLAGMIHSVSRYHNAEAFPIVMAPYALAICAFHLGTSRWLSYLALCVNALYSAILIFGAVVLAVKMNAPAAAGFGAPVGVLYVANTYVMWRSLTNK